MHAVLFTSDDQIFAIPTGCVVEVVPAVEWRSLPHADRWVKGVFNYRGALLPLLDFAALLRQADRPLQRSSRILVLSKAQRCVPPKSGATVAADDRPNAAVPHAAAPTVDESSEALQPRLGLLVQRVLGSEHLEFRDGARLQTYEGLASRFLGPVAFTPSGTIQLIDANQLPTA